MKVIADDSSLQLYHQIAMCAFDLRTYLSMFDAICLSHCVESLNEKQAWTWFKHVSKVTLLLQRGGGGGRGREVKLPFYVMHALRPTYIKIKITTNCPFGSRSERRNESAKFYTPHIRQAGRAFSALSFSYFGNFRHSCFFAPAPSVCHSSDGYRVIMHLSNPT